MKSEQFTFERAYEIQSKDLERWAKVLNTETYIALIKEVLRRNRNGYHSPQYVARGCDLTDIVVNLSY